MNACIHAWSTTEQTSRGISVLNVVLSQTTMIRFDQRMYENNEGHERKIRINMGLGRKVQTYTCNIIFIFIFYFYFFFTKRKLNRE